MNVRKAYTNDIDRIMVIYAMARSYMKQNGNPTQWGENHPHQSIVENDIANGWCYVVTSDDGDIHGVFALIAGVDPTYRIIENGAWLNDNPYGTIHRIAADGQAKGIGKACFDFCKTAIPDLRCDTHHDNLTMQQVLLKNGFRECGTIYVEDGTARIAYQYSLSMTQN